MTSTGCLSRAECEHIANTIHKGCALINYDLVPFCKDTRGYLGKHLRLNLTIRVGNNKKEVSCFVKTIEGGNLTLCFADANLYAKEVFVYKLFAEIKRVLPGVKSEVIPKVYYTNNETETVVVENLCEQDFKGTEWMKFDEAHMLVTLEALAKFHSVSIGYEEFKSKQLQRRYRLDEDYKDIMEPIYTCDESKSGNQFVHSTLYGVSALIDLVIPNEELRKVLMEKFRERVDLFLDALNNVKKFRKVLSHGDLWGYNVLFKYDNKNNPVESKLVDFQLSRYTPPAHDLTLLVYMASDRNTFKKNLQKYYKYYYDRLAFELKQLNLNIEDILPQEELKTTCELYMKVAKFTWMCYRQTSQSKDEYFSKIAQNVDTLSSVILGKGRYGYVKQNFLDDEAYKDALTEILEDNVHSLKSELISPEQCFELIQEKLGNVQYTFIGHEVLQGDGDKCKLAVRIVRDGKEEEYTYALDVFNNDIIGYA